MRVGDGVCAPKNKIFQFFLKEIFAKLPKKKGGSGEGRGVGEPFRPLR